MGIEVSTPETGQIRLQTERNVLVEIGDTWYDMYHKRTYWRATEIDSGEFSWVMKEILGEPLNAMEVLAWAAQ